LATDATQEMLASVTAALAGATPPNNALMPSDAPLAHGSMLAGTASRLSADSVFSANVTDVVTASPVSYFLSSADLSDLRTLIEASWGPPVKVNETNVQSLQVHGVDMYATNPTISADHRLIKVQAWSYCTTSKSAPATLEERSARFGMTGATRVMALYSKDGSPPQLLNGEDARLFHFDDRLHMVYQQYAFPSFWARALYYFTGASSYVATQRLAQLEPSYREVQMAWLPFGTESSEKNWLPVAHEGVLYMHQGLCPVQRVLVCNAESGGCTVALLDEAPAACAAVGSSKFVRGGAPPVGIELAGEKVMLGLGHETTMLPLVQGVAPAVEREYRHALFVTDGIPPFRLRAFSPWFRFPARHHNAIDEVQFGTSLVVEGDDVVIGYGVGDCEGFTTRVPLAELLPLARPLTR